MGKENDRLPVNKEKQRANQAVANTVAPDAAADPYGSAGLANQSVRRRGSSEQQRVGQDTRVRGDQSSGTAGAAGSSIGKAMAEATGSAVGQPMQTNSLWQATRQPTDLASIQQRVLQSLLNPTQRGQ